MPVTGWTGEPPEAPEMPLAAQMLRNRERGPGDVLALAQARSYDRPDPVSDPDERAANMIAAGLMPGQVSDLAQRHAAAVRAAQGEREKIAAGERMAERVRGLLERGQIGALEASRLMDPDPDPDTGDSKFGDAHHAEQLEARAESLGRQLADAQAMASPQPQQAPDPLEAASRRAHEAFVSATRAKLEAAQAGRPAPRERRPFASASRGGAAARSEYCVHCTREGLDDQTSYLLHSDPELNVPVTPPGQAAEAEQAEHAGYRSEWDGRVPMIYR